MDPFVTELSLYFPWWESNGCCLKWKKTRREEKPCAHRKARKGEFGVPGEELDQFGSLPHLPCKRPAVTDADSVSIESRLGPPPPVAAGYCVAVTVPPGIQQHVPAML